MAKNKNLKPGDKVTCKHPVEAYYGTSVFRPGMVGTVMSVSPKVRMLPPDKSHDSKVHFLTIDYDCPSTGRKERCGLNYINTVLIP